jgi:predicted dehydrogenase
VQRDEPLRRELADFVDAVRERRSPRVPANAGRAALALATEVAARIQSQSDR